MAKADVMMSMKAVAISAGMLLALFGSSPLWGQPPRHPPGGGRDPFFEALREVHQESPNKELFDLLEYPDIRDEVRLSAEKAEQIQENIRLAIKELFALRASRQANSEPHKSKEELKAEIAAAVAPFDDASYALLEQPPTELDRLLGIYVQARGNRAVLNEKVAHRIGLNATELDQLRKARTRIWRGIMQQAREDIQREIRNRAPGKEDLRKEFSKHIRHAERKFDLEFEAELTASQRQALEQLKGEKIDLPPTLYDYSRGGGGRERGRSDRSRESQRNPPRPTADSPPSKSSAPKPPGPESSPEECTVTPQPQLVNSADE